MIEPKRKNSVLSPSPTRMGRRLKMLETRGDYETTSDVLESRCSTTKASQQVSGKLAIVKPPTQVSRKSVEHFRYFFSSLLPARRGVCFFLCLCIQFFLHFTTADDSRRSTMMRATSETLYVCFRVDSQRVKMRLTCWNFSMLLAHDVNPRSTFCCRASPKRDIGLSWGL